MSGSQKLTGKTIRPKADIGPWTRDGVLRNAALLTDRKNQGSSARGTLRKKSANFSIPRSF